MRCLDLFSGIGGLALGFHRAGIQTAAFCEVAEFPRKVLAKNFPGVPIYPDVRTLNGAQLAADGIGHIDIIAGGFPCQDVSLAAGGTSRAGVDGERSGLWVEYARLVGEIRPAWVFAENSPALRVRGADRVLGDLERLGYACWPFVVGAVHAGAPHGRRRVFILANRVVPGLEVQLESREGQLAPTLGASPWAIEPDVGRVAYGVPRRVDRIVGLGNAVVPDVAEAFGRVILNHHLSADRETSDER